jgi:4-hydroxybutyryl-CoA dehydratase/vinylacetyl-CoA-Delta-isomerase
VIKSIAKGGKDMGLKTAVEYRQSLKDGRVVYLNGEPVEDVTTHPALEVGVDTDAFDYEIAEMPEYRDLTVVTDEKTGEPISRYYYSPKNSDDLLKRHELMVTGTRANQGVVPFTKDIGADAMNTASMTAQMMGKKEYIERAENFRVYLQKNDLSMAGAMTDVKGNRVLRPSDPKQTHPDYINEHEAASILLATEPVVMEKFVDIPELGRFVLVRDNNIGAGVVLDIPG